METVRVHNEQKGRYFGGKMIFQSTIFRIVAVIIALVLPINIMTLVLSNMVLQKNNEQISQEIENTLNTSAENLEDVLKRGSRKLIYLSVENTDFVEFASRSLDANQKVLRSMSVRDELEDLAMDYPWVDLMFFQFPANDSLIMTGHPGFSVTVYREEILSRIQAMPERSRSGFHWQYLMLDDTAALLGITRWNNACFGVLLNLERTLDKLNLTNPAEGRCIFFTDAEYTMYTRAGAEYLKAQEMTLEELTASRRYSVFDTELSEYGLHLVEVMEWDRQNENLPAAIVWVQWLSIILTILVIPLLLLYVRRWISRPLYQLVNAIERIEGGDLDYRIQIGGEGREFGQINRSFNDMMDEVQGLKIDVYEKELERKNSRMRYLSQQIQPHFILNAMNILYSYEPEEYPLIQKMVLCISKYFRYIVKVNARFVELSQEMEHIKNYFEIQKARYPELFFSIVEYEDDLGKALIPPLLVQNFAENAFKHSLKIGNRITIFVIAEHYPEKGGRRRMRIRLADTGDGMPDEVLAKIERFKETGEMQEGLGVGIQNSIERMKYLYEEENSIRFWRDEHYSGTNVEIILPVYFAEGEWAYEDIVD